MGGAHTHHQPPVHRRREGFEFAVGPPTVITKVIDGKKCEPYEEALVEVPQEHMGQVGRRSHRKRTSRSQGDGIGTPALVKRPCRAPSQQEGSGPAAADSWTPLLRATGGRPDGAA